MVTRNKDTKVKKTKPVKKPLNVVQIRKKYEAWLKLNQKEQKHYEDYLIEKCDQYCSRIRRFQCAKGTNYQVACVSQWIPICKWPVTRQAGQNCHGIKRAYFSHRRDPRNTYLGCSSCNYNWEQDHYNAITARIIKDHWLEVREEMRATKNKVRPTIERLLTKLEELKTEHTTLWISAF